MRTAFINALVEQAESDRRLFLMTGDLGYSVLERFADRHPASYVNVGVCEQAMAGIAAGLALSGRKVVTYSIANFPTLRCLEQIRNDICYHNANVMTVAIGGGVAYGTHGYTHHGVEDLGIMAMLPNMCVVCPADPTEVEAILPQLIEREGPSYLRLGRNGEERLYPKGTPMTLGKANWLKEGNDIAFLATGSIVANAMQAAARLEEKGISAGVASFHTVSPLDHETVRQAVTNYKAIVCVEEHVTQGGFGTMVADALLSMGKAPAFAKFGVTDEVRKTIGSQAFLIGRMGDLATVAENTLQRRAAM